MHAVVVLIRWRLARHKATIENGAKRLAIPEILEKNSAVSKAFAMSNG
jgi:hypothetical protein